MFKVMFSEVRRMLDQHGKCWVQPKVILGCQDADGASVRRVICQRGQTVVVAEPTYGAVECRPMP